MATAGATSPLHDRSNTTSPDSTSAAPIASKPCRSLSSSSVGPFEAPVARKAHDDGVSLQVRADGRARLFGGLGGGGTRQRGTSNSPGAGTSHYGGLGRSRTGGCEGGDEHWAEATSRTAHDWSYVERTPSPLPGTMLHSSGTGEDAEGSVDELDTPPECSRIDPDKAERPSAQVDDDTALLRQFTSAFSPSPRIEEAVPRREKRQEAARVSLFDERVEEEGREAKSHRPHGESVEVAEKATSHLALSPFVTPARPAGLTRSVSHGTGRSSRHLVQASTSEDDPVPSSPGPHDSSRLSPLAQNLIRILAHPERLPLGLVPLLESCVREADAAGRGLAVGSMSTLAFKAGLFAPSTTGGAPVEVDEMPPPASRLPVQVRSLSMSTTTASSRSGTASSSSSTPRSSSISSGSGMQSVPPSEVAKSCGSSSDADIVRPLPPKCHPPRPRRTPLRYVYESGDTSYEDERRHRSRALVLRAEEEVRAHKAALALAGVVEDHVEPQSSVGSNGEAVQDRLMDVEEERADEVVDAALPGGSRSAVAPARALPGGTSARASGRPAKAKRAQSRMPALAEEVLAAQGAEDWGVRRSKRARQSAPPAAGVK